MGEKLMNVFALVFSAEVLSLIGWLMALWVRWRLHDDPASSLLKHVKIMHQTSMVMLALSSVIFVACLVMYGQGLGYEMSEDATELQAAVVFWLTIVVLIAVNLLGLVLASLRFRSMKIYVGR